jgi:SPOR domain
MNALRHLHTRDKQALAAFLGLALLGFLYFASGILVTYVSSPDGTMQLAKDGRGFTVRVLGLQNFSVAERLSAALQEQRQVPAVIESAPADQGYLIRIGPFARRRDAEKLMDDLHVSGYDKTNIVESCPPGIANCKPAATP